MKPPAGDLLLTETECEQLVLLGKKTEDRGVFRRFQGILDYKKKLAKLPPVPPLPVRVQGAQQKVAGLEALGLSKLAELQLQCSQQVDPVAKLQSDLEELDVENGR